MSTIGSIQGFGSSFPGKPGLDPASISKKALAQMPAGIAPAGHVAPSEIGQSADGIRPASFSNILERAVHEVDGKMRSADVEQSKLLAGETTNLHQSMIAMQEASVSFSLMVEVRNKLVDSYQELMRMQV